MAYQNLDGIESYPAGADLSALRGIGVVINASGQAVAAGAGVAPDGILDNAPVSGAQARVILRRGIRQPVRSGGNLAVGNAVAVNAAGKVILAVTGNVIIGRAVEACTGADKIVSIIFTGHSGIAP